MPAMNEAAAPAEAARRELPVEAYRALIGQEIACSKWFEMSQDRINAFAAATDDWSDIHLHAEHAGAMFGGTIAHGFLTLSMIAAMAIDSLPRIAGRRVAVNYGFDKVRLIAPLPSGSHIRGRFVLAGIEDRTADEIIARIGVTVEIRGSQKPALVAEWLYHTTLG